MKLVGQLGTCPGAAAKLIDSYTKSRDAFLQQSCLEFQSILMSSAEHLGSVFPVDASCEDVGADENLSIVQAYVDAAVAKGASLYVRGRRASEGA
jgi:AP-4 complex subunit epsilon-1